MMQSIGELSGSEVLNLITNGEVLFCPVCNSALVTIPNTIQNGERPIGVACPVNQKHYLVHGEKTESLKEMRKRMKAMRENR